MVFIELCRRGYRVYFHKKMKECDFVCLRNNQIISAIQVCEFLSEFLSEFLTLENRARETEGLLETMDTYHLIP